ncbi:MAG TPA: PAN domain-containing protein, partial [Ramlibacter sp.]|nr:PAN domain-containing protein [Ramlibacter sp.]
SDYRNFELAGNDPLACRAACETEGACRSWTFVRPGVQGPAARCWLKGSVPQAQPNACCTSGVKTAVAPPPPPQGNNACNTACEQRCRQRGRPGGAYNGGICLLGVPEESACTCR